MSLLEVEHLTKNFGGLSAVANVTLSVEADEIVGLIGPNGAGKTTLFNLLTGVYPPTEGKITFAGNDVAKLAPYQVAMLGVGRTFQNIRLFKDLTVLENVMVALHPTNSNLLTSILRLPGYYQRIAQQEAAALKMLEFFDLADKAAIKASNLPYGQQRVLEIARALAMKPKILFLDEPAAGMNPNETNELTQLIRKIHQEFGVAIVLIEHDMSLVMEVCQRICVLEYGRVLKIGTPQEVQNDPQVIAAYLGGDA
ncbi:ABC transporter ATP-binding protein [Enterococcus nangangensis]|uniref:ABC transporter ATP-binding protein n=1 Tax=Enterococcus nangangensis TaxID=2559926 RepID=UPI0010FA26BB|nr:ABC transporter ATP-binding protein [Enterococcus nangangensis]